MFVEVQVVLINRTRPCKQSRFYSLKAQTCAHLTRQSCAGQLRCRPGRYKAKVAIPCFEICFWTCALSAAIVQFYLDLRCFSSILIRSHWNEFGFLESCCGARTPGRPGLSLREPHLDRRIRSSDRPIMRQSTSILGLLKPRSGKP